MFDDNNIRICQLGSHPIPQPQIELMPARSSCVHCLEDQEITKDVPDIKPRLMNGGPCPTCKTFYKRDPEKYSHRKGRTEVRLINEDGTPYICCTLHDYMKKGSCAYSRKLREDDEIEYLQLNQDLDLKLFVDEPKMDSNALNPIDLKDNKEINDLIGKIEYKIEEINELLKKLRDFAGK